MTELSVNKWSSSPYHNNMIPAFGAFAGYSLSIATDFLSRFAQPTAALYSLSQLNVRHLASPRFVCAALVGGLSSHVLAAMIQKGIPFKP